jgi:hypothetical protein
MKEGFKIQQMKQLSKIFASILNSGGRVVSEKKINYYY